jgi:hypothetical protein
MRQVWDRLWQKAQAASWDEQPSRLFGTLGHPGDENRSNATGGDDPRSSPAEQSGPGSEMARPAMPSSGVARETQASHSGPAVEWLQDSQVDPMKENAYL